MPAYAIFDVEKVFDKEKLPAYQKVDPKVIQQFEGKILVRGGASMSLEGEWTPKRLVVVEFPNYEKAKEWAASQENLEATALRKQAANSRVIIVEGV